MVEQSGTTKFTKKGNPAQVRDRIDHGETGEKVDFSDPAVAPLGTDAEAGGPSRPVVPRPNVRSEGGGQQRSLNHTPRTPAQLQNGSSGWLGILLAIICIAAVLVALFSFV
ncbi:hypothetical protein G0P98_25995 [Yangia sp. PrR004]|nr:hypothetical protein [Salipiger sp. PrR004]